jgi:hypothetical protein
LSVMEFFARFPSFVLISWCCPIIIFSLGGILRIVRT